MTQEILRSSEVADVLAAELGGTSTHWHTWLKNDRKPGRKNLLPPLPGPGRPRYLMVAVEALIAAERARRMQDGQPVGRAAEVMKAFGIGEGGTNTGRHLEAHVYGQLDEHAKVGFVQLHVLHPMLMFRLTPDQARQLAAELIEEAKYADRMESIVKGKS